MAFVIVDGFVTDPRSMDEYMRDMERELRLQQESDQSTAPRPTGKPSAHWPKGKRPTRPIGRRYS